MSPEKVIEARPHLSFLIWAIDKAKRDESTVILKSILFTIIKILYISQIFIKFQPYIIKFVPIK